MKLKSLNLLNYRNFEELNLVFSDKINCFIGKNGVGKTNILDSIYYLAFCKSWLNPVDSQNIRFGSDFFLIKGYFGYNDLTDTVSCSFKAGKKKSFKRNDKEYSKLSNHIGLIPLVTVSPYDSELILGGSEERRRFIDIVISQFDKDYLNKLLKYNKILNQRNQLLKQMPLNSYFDHEAMEVWDLQLISLGNALHAKRKEYLENIIPIFNKYYSYISSEKEFVSLVYKSQLNEGDFATILQENIEKDRIFQFTTSGLHKDDLLFQLSGHPLRKNASQGQQKTYLMALKLAQFDYINQVGGIKPILLFDDIFDKLDEERVKQIIHLVADHHFGQIFITDTDHRRLDSILNNIHIDYKLFEINDGIIEREERFEDI
ncbi:MAG: DNA replication/repair protein RecF [Bacteroidales bacterium]